LREVETPRSQGRAPRPAMVSGLMLSDVQLAAGYRASGLVLWPMAEAMAAARHGRLLGVKLPAASPFVNPDSAHHGPRREAGGASIIPPDATASAAIRGHHRGVEPATCRAAGQERGRWRDRPRGPRLPAWCRAAPASSSALGCEALDAPCRRWCARPRGPRCRHGGDRRQHQAHQLGRRQK
jgi:hypothetical protein